MSNSKNLSKEWKIHVPNLLGEILSNPTTSILTAPLKILAMKLEDVAARAIELDDAKLLKLCCDLCLFEESDPKSPSFNPEFVALVAAKAKAA